MKKKNTNRIGDISELNVCSNLLELGYEVFRNVACTGLIDVIIYSPISKKTHLLDVKTCTPYHKENGEINYTTGQLKEDQINIGVKIIFMLENKAYIKDKDQIIEFKEYDLLTI